MSDNIIPGSTNVSVEFLVDSVVDITTMRIGSMRWTEGDGTSFVETAAGSNLTELALITTAHTDNAGIYLSTNTLVGNQFLIRADFPDSHFASGKDRVICTLYDGDLNIAAKEYTLEAAPATLANQINIEAKIDDVPTVAEFNARTIASASYGTLTNQTNIETKIDDVPTVSEFNARTISSGSYGLVTNQTDIENKVDNLPTVAEFEARTLLSAAYALLTNQTSIETKVDDIPNNAEFNARTLVAAAYATLTNQTNIETKVDDIPTTAEFEARTLLAAVYATLQKQNDQFTLTDTRLGNPYELEDGSTPSSITEMLSEMGEQVSVEGTYSRGDNSLQALSGKLDNVGLLGTAINKTATSLTLTTGSIGSGTVPNTRTIDGQYQILNDDAGVLDGYYEFNIGGNGIPVNGTWIGYLQSNNDTAILQAFDWNDTSFEQVAVVAGQNGVGNSTIPFTLFPDHVGTGVDIGKVRIRVLGTGMTSAVFATDQLFVSYGLNNQSGGYEGGKVWVKVGGVNGTELNVNGTVDNPVGNWADAQTIATNKNLSRFHIGSATTIVLDQDLVFAALEGESYNVVLNGWSIEGTKFEGAGSISGVALGGLVPPFFKACGIGDVTLPPSNGLQNGLFGTITIGSEGSFVWGECATVLANSDPAIIDFGAGLNASDFTIHSWGGGALEIRNAGAGTGEYTFTMAGMGSLIVNANCSANTLVTIDGNIVRNADIAGVTYDDEGRTVPTTIDTELTSQHGAGSWQAGGGGGGGGLQKFVASGQTINGATDVTGSYIDTQNVGVSNLVLEMASGVLDYELLFNVGIDHSGLSTTLRLTTNTRFNRFAEVQIYDYDGAAAFVKFIDLEDMNGIFETLAIGSVNNDFIDTNGDIRIRFLQTSFSNGDTITVDHVTVSTQTTAGTIPSPEEIALAVDGQLSSTHGQSSWEGNWIKQTSVNSITTPDTVFVVAPKLGSDIDKAGIVVARFRDADGNDDFVQVLSYVESTGVMTIAENPDFSLTIGDKIDLAVEIGGEVIETLDSIETKVDDLPTNAEFNARTVLSAIYATLSNQTNIEGKIDNVPTVSEFEARTILSSLYATLTNQSGIIVTLGSPANIDFGGATLADNLKKLADNSNGTSFNAATDSQKSIRDRGDAAWVTGSGGDATEANQITILANQVDIESKVDAVKVDTAAILVDTDVTIPALIEALNDLSDAEVWAFAVRTLTAGTNLNDLSASEVNAEMVDVIRTDTTGEPGQGKPPESTSLQEKVDYLFKFAINKMDQNATTKQVYNYDGTIVDQKSTVDFTDPLFTDGEFNSGP